MRRRFSEEGKKKKNQGSHLSIEPPLLFPKSTRIPSLLITQNLPTTTVRRRRSLLVSFWPCLRHSVVDIASKVQPPPFSLSHSLVSSSPTTVFAVTAAAFPSSLLLPDRLVRSGWLLQRETCYGVLICMIPEAACFCLANVISGHLLIGGRFWIVIEIPWFWCG